MLSVALPAGSGAHHRYGSSDSDADSIYFEANESLTPHASNSSTDLVALERAAPSPLRAAVLAAAPATAVARAPTGSSVGLPAAVQLASANDVTGLRALLAASPRALHERDAHKRTALMAAALEGHVAAVEFLLDNNADVYARDLGGFTALMHAVGANREHVTRALLKVDANPNAQAANDGSTALMMACMMQLEGVVDALLQAKADPNVINNKHETALMYAAHAGRVSIVRKLLRQGANLSALNLEGISAFVHATSNGHVDAARALLEHADAANAAAQDVPALHDLPGLVEGVWDDASPLHIAAFTGNEAVVAAVLDTPLTPLLLATKGVLYLGSVHSSSIDRMWWRDNDGRTALMVAALCGHTALFAYLVHRAGSNAAGLVAATDKNHATVFHYIAQKGTVDILGFIRSSSALSTAALPLDAVDVRRGTAITVAASIGHLDVVNALLAMGAQAQFSGHGTTPLIAACQAGCEEVACALIRHLHERLPRQNRTRRSVGNLAPEVSLESVLNTTDANNWTALMFAAGKNMSSAVKQLVARGADVNVRGLNNGATALMLAATGARVSIVECLIGAGARLHDQTSNGLTALDLAQQANRPRLVSVLRAAAEQQQQLQQSQQLQATAADGMRPAQRRLGAHPSSSAGPLVEGYEPTPAIVVSVASQTGLFVTANDPLYHARRAHAGGDDDGTALMTFPNTAFDSIYRPPAAISSSVWAPIGRSIPTTAPAPHQQLAPQSAQQAQPFISSFSAMAVGAAPHLSIGQRAGSQGVPSAYSVSAASASRSIPVPSANAHAAAPPGLTMHPMLGGSPPVHPRPTPHPMARTITPPGLGRPIAPPQAFDSGSAAAESGAGSRGWPSPANVPAAAPPAAAAPQPAPQPQQPHVHSTASAPRPIPVPAPVATWARAAAAAESPSGSPQQHHHAHMPSAASTRRKSSSTPATAPVAMSSTPPGGSSGADGGAVDRRLDSVGAIRYNRSLRLGTGSHGTQVYQGFYRNTPAAIKRMPRHSHADPTGQGVSDQATEREIQLLIQLSKYRDVVPKKLSPQSSMDGESDAADAQTKALIASGRHNIVRYFGREMNEDFVFLAMEKCQHTLLKLIKDSRSSSEFFFMLYQEPITLTTGERLPPVAPTETVHEKSHPLLVRHMPVEQVQVTPTQFTLRMLYSLFQGVAFLHSMNLVHNDLKPANILLTDNFEIKIADMGLAKTLSEDQSSFSFQAAADGSVVAPTGLGGFFAPEVILEGRKTRKVDVFSVGCLAFYVLTLGGHPFEMSGVRGQRDSNIIAGRYDLSRLNHLPQAAHLIDAMIQFDPSKRISMTEALRHPLFADMRG